VTTVSTLQRQASCDHLRRWPKLSCGGSSNIIAQATEANDGASAALGPDCCLQLDRSSNPFKPKTPRKHISDGGFKDRSGHEILDPAQRLT
jgi:hypothetical protein